MPSVKVKYHDIEIGSYSSILEMQINFHNELISAKLKRKHSNSNLNQIIENHLILCEHQPVYTLGRSGKITNLILSEKELSAKGIDFHETSRGGDITYHGPGQIVGYPIFDLDCFYHDIHRFVRDIEEVIIRTLDEFSIKAERIENLTGVWVKNDNSGKEEKICAIGIHLSRWVSLHGFALNVNTDLSYFGGIIPCGISDPKLSVCSMESLLGKKIDIKSVKDIIVEKFEEVFNFKINK